MRRYPSSAALIQAAPRTRRRKSIGLIAFALAGAVAAASVVAVVLSAGPPSLPANTPSIVLILTDDQRYDTLWAMPNLREHVAAHGVTFTNAFVVNPLCCPSRASILTGKYSHGTDVYKNVPPHGGYESFTQLEGSTVAAWLHEAGYETGLFGKYLNGYTGSNIPPGWDRWSAFAVPNNAGGAYYDYTLNTDGVLVSRGSDDLDYSTDVLASQAEAFIRAAEGPLFLYFAPFAPHGATIPAPRHSDTFPNLEVSLPDSYNEQDVSDKPSWVRDLPTVGEDKQARIAATRRPYFQSLLAVDEALEGIVQALSDTGRLGNTLIVFASDNGKHWGEHRLSGKETPYEESIRIPAVVRYDPLTRRARTDDNLVLNIDLAPTFAELAGVPARGVDGQSLLPVLETPSAQWREDFLVEHLRAGARDEVPTYCQVRSADWSYIKYETGEEELYDMTQDPYQLQNVAGDEAQGQVLSRMRDRLATLCSPPPPGFTAVR